MKKSIIHIVLSGLLTFSVLLPSVFNLLEANTDTIVLIDFNEEDNQKKCKKDIEEKNFLFYSELYISESFGIIQTGLFNYYQEGFSSFTSKILLPPPELNG